MPMDLAFDLLEKVSAGLADSGFTTNFDSGNRPIKCIQRPR